MRLLQNLRHDVERQCEDFYRLAEQMAKPVRKMETDLHASCWAEAREQGQQVLADTEATLTRAKQEHARLPFTPLCVVASAVVEYRYRWHSFCLHFWGKYIYSGAVANHEP